MNCAQSVPGLPAVFCGWLGKIKKPGHYSGLFHNNTLKYRRNTPFNWRQHTGFYFFRLSPFVVTLRPQTKKTPETRRLAKKCQAKGKGWQAIRRIPADARKVWQALCIR
jgi:hypothetical protein